MSSAMATRATATATATESRVGTVAVFLAGLASDEAVIDAAVSAAADYRARISIFAIPRRVPAGAHCVALGYTGPVNVLALRAEALVDAATAARRAADLVPAAIPAEHVVVPGSPIRAMQELLERDAAAHIMVDRNLLVRRRRLRWSLGRLARGGMPLEIV